VSPANGLHHFTQERAGGENRIGFGHRIAPRNKAGGSAPGKKTVQEKTALAISKDDLAGLNVGKRATRNFDSIARPERRQHACSLDLQPQGAAPSESVHRHRRTLPVPALRPRTHGVFASGCFSRELTLSNDGAGFPASQRERLENTLVAESRLLIGLLASSRVLRLLLLPLRGLMV
jgi:hypothetical protein